MRVEDIPDFMLRAIFRQAECEYPKECCGVILGRQERAGSLTELWPCRNKQDDVHALSPKEFPKTSKEAYLIDPEELLSIQREARKKREGICVIYHSHPDTAAVWSRDDEEQATKTAKLLPPEVHYLVVSVEHGKAQTARMFRVGGFQEGMD